MKKGALVHHRQFQTLMCCNFCDSLEIYRISVKKKRAWNLIKYLEWKSGIIAQLFQINLIRTDIGLTIDLFIIIFPNYSDDKINQHASLCAHLFLPKAATILEEEIHRIRPIDWISSMSDLRNSFYFWNLSRKTCSVSLQSRILICPIIQII